MVSNGRINGKEARLAAYEAPPRQEGVERRRVARAVQAAHAAEPLAVGQVVLAPEAAPLPAAGVPPSPAASGLITLPERGVGA